MDQLQFFKIVYGFGVSPVTVTFVVQCTMEDLDKEVRRVALLKGINAYGVFLSYSAQKVECPTGEWSSERWEAIRQLELEHNIYLHSLSKDDCDVATTELEDPLILTPERWMQLRAEMHENDAGLCGDDGQEKRYIQDVYEAMIKREQPDYNYRIPLRCGICNEQWFDDLIAVTFAQRPTYVCGPCYDQHCK
jgi:hypothetical protein